MSKSTYLPVGVLSQETVKSLIKDLISQLFVSSYQIGWEDIYHSVAEWDLSPCEKTQIALACINSESDHGYAAYQDSLDIEIVEYRDNLDVQIFVNSYDDNRNETVQQIGLLCKKA